jgi:hypothetical protein
MPGVRTILTIATLASVLMAGCQPIAPPAKGRNPNPAPYADPHPNGRAGTTSPRARQFLVQLVFTWQGAEKESFDVHWNFGNGDAGAPTLTAVQRGTRVKPDYRVSASWSRVVNQGTLVSIDSVPHDLLTAGPAQCTISEVVGGSPIQRRFNANNRGGCRTNWIVGTD